MTALTNSRYNSCLKCFSNKLHLYKQKEVHEEYTVYPEEKSGWDRKQKTGWHQTCISDITLGIFSWEVNSNHLQYFLLARDLDHRKYPALSSTSGVSLGTILQAFPAALTSEEPLLETTERWPQSLGHLCYNRGQKYSQRLFSFLVSRSGKN